MATIKSYTDIEQSKKLVEILPLDDKCLNDYGKALVWRLKNCIEQLKK